MLNQRIDFIQGHSLDLLRKLQPQSVHCVITSSPYWGLRSYDTKPQIWGGEPDCPHVYGFKAPTRCCPNCGAWLGEHGQEPTLQMWLAHEVQLFREVRRVLRDDGTLWLNLGDTYATTPNGTAAAVARDRGHDDRTFRDKPHSTATKEIPAKNRLMLPARLAIALQEDGWWLRDEVIHNKANPMSSSVQDRTCPAHEMVYLFAKQPDYYFDDIAIEEPCSPNTRPRRTDGRTIKAVDGGLGYDRRVDSLRYTYSSATRRKRSVWSLVSEPSGAAHFATFPTALVEPMILASTSARGVCHRCGAPHRRLRPPRRPPGQAPAQAHGQPAARPLDLPEGLRPPRPSMERFVQGCACVGSTPVPATVLDPFAGSGTVGVVATRLGRSSILLELNPLYLEIAKGRVAVAMCEVTVAETEKRRRWKSSSVG